MPAFTSASADSPGSTHGGILAVVIGIGLAAVLKLLLKSISAYFSPLRHLRGPPSISVLSGNLTQSTRKYLELNKEWVAQYGSSFRAHGLFLVRCLSMRMLRGRSSPDKSADRHLLYGR